MQKSTQGRDDNLLPVILRLEDVCAAQNYAGYDPFDALRSRWLRLIPVPGKYPRIALIQLLKRLPVNVRPLLLVPRGHNPKGMGLFLSSYVDLFRVTGRVEWLAKARKIAGWLLQNSSEGYSGKCWGYNFDWQSRAFFVPAGTPTIVNTSFIAQAFLDLYSVTEESEFLQAAESAAHFILTDLHRSQTPDGFCFSYTPIDRTMVHNASMLGAGFLARLYGFTREMSYLEAARTATYYTVVHQREDGAWYYAETSYQSWIDSFHTGFVLRSLREVCSVVDSPVLEAALDKGLNYFLKNFIQPDGCVKYYHDNLRPVDIHSFAETLRLCSVFYSDARCRQLAPKVISWLMQNMYDSRHGYFYYRKLRYFTNRIHYIRWSSAWMLYGLTGLVQAESRWAHEAAEDSSQPDAFVASPDCENEHRGEP